MVQSSASIPQIADHLKKRWTEFVQNEWNEHFLTSWGSRSRLGIANVPVNNIAFGMPTRPSRGIFLQAICESPGLV